MPEQSLSRLAPGNVINPSSGYAMEATVPYPKVSAFQFIGVGKVGQQPVTNIPLYFPSRVNEYVPDKPFIVPGTATDTTYIYYIGMRVARNDIAGANGETLALAPAIGDPAFVYPVAVTNDVIPVADLHEATPENGYATFQFPGADPSLPLPMGVTPGWAPSLWNLNAAQNALGTGIRSANPKEDAIIIVEICFCKGNRLVADEEAAYKGSWG